MRIGERIVVVVVCILQKECCGCNCNAARCSKTKLSLDVAKWGTFASIGADVDVGNKQLLIALLAMPAA